MILECATVTAVALAGAFLAGVFSAPVLEMLFALMMLQSAYFAMRQHGETLTQSDPLCARLHLGGTVIDETGKLVNYGVVHLPIGAVLMLIAGIMSGLLGVGAGAVKVTAMDYFMKLPLKISSATSNFMIGVTAGRALVFLSRGDVATTVAAPVALGVTAGALTGSRLLPHLPAEALRKLFVVLLLLIAIEMGWRAWSGI